MAHRDIKQKFGKDVNVLWTGKKHILGMPISFTRYYLVEKPGKFIKLVIKSGLLSTAYEETQLFRVDDLSLFKSFFNSLFGLGTITVYCDDASHRSMLILNIKDSGKVYNLLSDLVEQDRKERNVKIAEFQR